jgi:hypothetical protein
MLNRLFCFFIVGLVSSFALGQSPAVQKPAVSAKSTAPDTKLQDLLQAKIKAEWEALKKKDKGAYGELLAEDYEGVEVDGKGERSKIQALNEVPEGNIQSYVLGGFKVTPLSPDAAFVIYEVTIQFPPKSVLRYSRVYISELWVKRNGDWKVLHYQETHVK